MTQEILNKPLNDLSLSDILVVQQLADTLFARLVQPFKQERVVWKFDNKKTIRTALRTGHMLPSYSRQEVTHRKSSLVIAMSLSGIDRCFAVGLIPLLSQLRKYIDFKLFIYTDDLIAAEFTDDGFLANDHQIAWNNVVAPIVFSRLADMHFDAQETKLLLIDSLGGGDSEWYAYADRYLLETIRQAQAELTTFQWTNARNFLNGNYERFLSIPSLPRAWHEKLFQNVHERWVKTPALKEYMIRHVFNPDYGKKSHGSFPIAQYDTLYCRDFIGKIKEKFRSVHILMPSQDTASQKRRKELVEHGLLDFQHKADTLEGFAQVLINIVYGRETNRLTSPKVTFSKVYRKREEQEKTGHSELTKTLRNCFSECGKVDNYLPVSTFRTVQVRQANTIDLPYNNVEVSDFFYSLDSLYGDWRIDPLWSEYGKINKARSILNFIRTHRIELYGSFLIVSSEPHQWNIKPELEKHRTRCLQSSFDEFMSFFYKGYEEWFNKLPLRHVVWCTVGKFSPTNMAVSVRPSITLDEQKAMLFHEVSHWVEHVCPPIGVFTNNLLQYMTGGFDQHRVIKVGDGEYAMPTLNRFHPWIVPYAGKWYRRLDSNLPNPTEVFSVHAEFFRTPESLVTLLEHDPFVVKAVAFIMMGGPLALMDKFRNDRLDKLKKPLKELPEKLPKVKSKEYKEEVVVEETKKKSFGI